MLAIKRLQLQSYAFPTAYKVQVQQSRCAPAVRLSFCMKSNYRNSVAA